MDGTSSPQEDTNAPAGSVQNGEDVERENGEESGDGEQQKVVFIGSDVDRSWTRSFDVVEVAAEILANMACLVKNTVLSVAGTAAQDDEEYEDWSDDEESELKMEQIAANNSTSASQLSASPADTAVNDVSLLFVISPLNWK